MNGDGDAPVQVHDEHCYCAVCSATREAVREEVQKRAKAKAAEVLDGVDLTPAVVAQVAGAISPRRIGPEKPVDDRSLPPARPLEGGRKTNMK